MPVGKEYHLSERAVPVSQFSRRLVQGHPLRSDRTRRMTSGEESFWKDGRGLFSFHRPPRI